MRHSILTIALLMPAAALAQSVIDYDNTSFLQDISPSISKEYADDIHRVSSAPVSGLDFRYISHAADDLNLYLTVYRYDFFGPVPHDALLATYLFSGLPSNGEYTQHLDLPSPLAAPRDIWIGFRFVSATHDVIQMRLGGLPTVGSSMDGFAFDNDTTDPALDGIRETDAALENFFLRVYAVPEPTTIACFAVALCLTIVVARNQDYSR